ncbi:MAG TPA: hypothetical protein VMU50_23760 [Polyangia bacterium]|nr:hypothetical protein [Polyangia bacterium]
MVNGFSSAVLVLAGALCAMGGYWLGGWRHRLQLRLEMEAEDIDSHQRVLDTIESLADADRNRDERPN